MFKVCRGGGAAWRVAGGLELNEGAPTGKASGIGVRRGVTATWQAATGLELELVFAAGRDVGGESNAGRWSWSECWQQKEMLGLWVWIGCAATWRAAGWLELEEVMAARRNVWLGSREE